MKTTLGLCSLILSSILWSGTPAFADAAPPNPEKDNGVIEVKFSNESFNGASSFQGQFQVLKWRVEGPVARNLRLGGIWQHSVSGSNGQMIGQFATNETYEDIEGYAKLSFRAFAPNSERADPWSVYAGYKGTRFTANIFPFNFPPIPVTQVAAGGFGGGICYDAPLSSQSDSHLRFNGLIGYYPSESAGKGGPSFSNLVYRVNFRDTIAGNLYASLGYEAEQMSFDQNLGQATIGGVTFGLQYNFH